MDATRLVSVMRIASARQARLTDTVMDSVRTAAKDNHSQEMKYDQSIVCDDPCLDKVWTESEQKTSANRL